MPLITAALSCLVIGIADGDTLSARCDAAEGPTTIVVRLAEIDAPEKGQAWGARSRQHLSDLCFGRSATVTPRTRDRYGRTVARVECAGTDASTEQVRTGMAWVFDRYVSDRSLYAVQDEARSERRGLWRDDGALPPWEWRAARKGQGRPAS